MPADMKTWPRLLLFRQPMPAGRASRDFAAAVFVSVVIHALLASLLWVLISGRTAVEPAAPSIDTPLIVSLSRYTDASRDGLDLEAVPGVSHTAPPVQRTQSPREGSRSVERRHEAETVVTSKGQEIPGLEAPESKSPATDATPSFDLEAANRMAWDFGIVPEFKADTAVTSEGREIPGSETPGDKSLATCITPSFGPEAVYCMEREFGNMSESQVQNIRIKSRMLHISNYIAENMDPRLDCRTAYTGFGLFAIPALIKDAILGNGCKWKPVMKFENLGRHP